MRSKTGGIFNDDNKYNKSGIIGYNGTSNDDDYYPPAEPTKKGNTGSSKKGNSKAGAWGAIIVLAIIIFIVLHAVNTYYNMQDLEYFDNKVKEAQEKVNRLESLSYGNFILPYAYGEHIKADIPFTEFTKEQQEQIISKCLEFKEADSLDILKNTEPDVWLMCMTLIIDEHTKKD